MARPVRFSRALLQGGTFLLCLMASVTAQAQPLAEPQRAPVLAVPIAEPMPAASASVPTVSAPASAATKVAAPVKKTVKVGLLVPLTGRNASIGRALQDAATVALFDKYARLSLKLQDVKVQLIPKDTGDSSEFASAAAREAIDAGAELLIGPVSAEATEAAAPVAAARGVPMLSLASTRERPVKGVYLLGRSPKEEAERVVRYALDHGKRSIAVMVPRSALGEEVLAGARAAALKSDATLAVEVRYTPQALGVEEALNKIFTTDAPPHFDAVLLAEGGESLETLMRALSARDVTPDKVQFLGTGVWDDVALLRQLNLQGAWFASGPPSAIDQFESRFRSTYNYTPPRIASLAYDAVTLAVSIAVSGRPYGADTLTTDGGFIGPASGFFRLRPNGLTERNLAVLQVEGSNTQIISPAPSGFTK